MKHVTVLMLTLTILTWRAGVGQANVIPVPHDHEQIHQAVGIATAGDTVLVSNNTGGNQAYEPFTMMTGVPVLRAAGQEPKVSANGGNHAVAFPADSDTLTILDGFTLLGGDTTVVMRDRGILRNCSVDDDGDGTLIGVYHFRYGGRIENVDVTVDAAGEDATGILLHDSGADVKNCEVRIPNSSTLGAGIRFEHHSYSLTPTIESCFVSNPDGFGIEMDNGTIRSCTVDSTQNGIYDSGAGVIEGCIVSRAQVTGIYGVAVYVRYCIAPSFDLSGGPGTGNSTADPLFCDLAAGEYTLRVDSYGNPEINGYGLIGKYPVACMYGTLQRSAVFTEGGTLAFTKDLLVPDGLELTLGPASEIEVAAEDPDDAGVDEARVELVVEGALTLSGSSSNMVVFESAAEMPDEGNWRGVILGDDGEADIDYATIRHAVTGVENYEGDGLSITNSLFEMNDTADIDFKRTQQTSGSILVEDNTLNVGGGIGIRYNCTRTTILIGIHNNAVNMNSESSKGIELHGWYPNGSLSGNSISGGTAGRGIEFEWDTKGDGWILEGNHITNCQHGVYAHSSETHTNDKVSPLFDGNTITGCSTGAAAESSGVLGVFKYNTIASNTYGVRARSGANPDLGDTTTVAGYNNFSNNSAYCIQNLNASGTLMAQENYFGNVDCQSPPVPSCFTGSVDVSKVLCTDPTSVSMAKVPAVGTILAMRALPNPMNATGVVQFVLGSEALVSLRIFDITGRLVRDFGESSLAVGDHTVKWDGRDRRGRLVGSGVYFVNLVAKPGTSQTIKVLVAR